MRGEPISLKGSVRAALKRHKVGPDSGAVYLVQELMGAAGRVRQACSLNDACGIVARMRECAAEMLAKERELDRKPLFVLPPAPWKKY